MDPFVRRESERGTRIVEQEERHICDPQIGSCTIELSVNVEGTDNRIDQNSR